MPKIKYNHTYKLLYGGNAMKHFKRIALVCSLLISCSVLCSCGKVTHKYIITEKTPPSATPSPPITSENIPLTESTPSPLPTESNYTFKYALSNPNANDITHKVYDYICDQFNTSILSAQQESTWMGSPDYEMDYIEEITGKLPAIRGLDYMHDDFKGVNQRAKEWWDNGGLVTICWHSGINGKGYNESLKDEPDFEKLFTEGSDEYNGMIASWDRAANSLAELQDKGVVVLWRPFHEFDGQWFWWGKGGKDNFIKLWQMMYDRYTNEFGLNNLIWVLGYSGEVKDGWYPGDDYCDIIGSDTYDNSTNQKAWTRLQKLTPTFKPLTFHECGNVPSVEAFKEDACIWSWFMIWHTDHIKNNDPDNLKSVYNSDLVITLDELPNFINY